MIDQQIENFLYTHPRIELWRERGLHVIFIVIMVLVCIKLINIICLKALNTAERSKDGIERRSTERTKRLMTVIKLLDTSLCVVLYCTAGLMILKEIGLDITPLLTGAGIAGVALGFGAQSLVKDMISGFFILIEDQSCVGDVIRINNGLSGTVERMELRVIAIRDDDGTLHIIPNGEIKSVSNMTYEFANAVVTIPLPYNTDLTHLSEVIENTLSSFNVDSTWKPQLRDNPKFIGITDFLPTHMLVKITVKTDPNSRWSVEHEIRRRIVTSFDSAKISLPEAFKS
jgi:small conductance mechanosensitive channel